MFSRILLSLCVSLLLAPGLVAAQNSPSPVVVELYTSQGCSSCPPADALMHELAARDDVIPLALHVDYWDYIGWKDLYADPRFTRRQKLYARSSGRDMIYTPQMIVNGQEDVVGAKSMELADLIARHTAQQSGVGLRAEREGERLRIDVEPVAGGRDMQLCDIQLVRFDPERVAKITRGENAGRTLSYANVVADWQVVGQWDGATPLTIEVPLAGDMPAAVLIQRPGPGAIVAAIKVN